MLVVRRVNSLHEPTLQCPMSYWCWVYWPRLGFGFVAVTIEMYALFTFIYSMFPSPWYLIHPHSMVPNVCINSLHPPGFRGVSSIKDSSFRGFLKWGYLQLSSHFYRSDFPWNKPSSVFGVRPMTMGKPYDYSSTTLPRCHGRCVTIMEETSVAILTAIRWPLMSLHSLETLSELRPAMVGWFP